MHTIDVQDLFGLAKEFTAHQTLELDSRKDTNKEGEETERCGEKEPKKREK